MLPRCSPEDIRDGDDHNFADSGESLQRRTVKIRRLSLNEFDSRSMDAQSIMAELRGLFSWHERAYFGEVNFVGARVSSGERTEKNESGEERKTGAVRAYPRWRTFL
jgi:hypothetical protein